MIRLTTNISHFLLSVIVSALVSIPLAVIMSCSSASANAKTPDAVARETARGAVTITADAVSKLDSACAGVVMATRDRAFGEKCDAVYKTARTSLIVAASAVDTWDAVASRQEVTCRVLAVAAGIADIGRELKAKAGPADAIAAIDDAVSFSRLLGACTSTARAGGAS